MSHSFVIQQTTKEANQKVNIVFAGEYSKKLKSRIKKITKDDYEKDFNDVFGDFGDRRLPRDEIFF